MAHKWVYAFSEGAADMRALLGGKGAGLAEMTRLGVPVPDGFTITTEACVATTGAGGTWPDGLAEQVDEALQAFEERTGVPMVLNTSFNENEPIVNTPGEALDCFLRTRMDLLVMGDWIVRRT